MIDKNENGDLEYRRIRNFLRKHSSNIGDDYQLRKMLLRMFYYDINGYPIAKMKNENDIDYNNYPDIFRNKKREEIIDIYNKEIKSKSLIKILTEEELGDYDINNDISLKISLKTFRPIYKENWREISEEINKVPFKQQKSFYAEYLKCLFKIRRFPTLDEFMKFLFNKNQLPIHKDIKKVFENIDNSYKEVKEFVKINEIKFEEIKKILIKSTSIPNRIIMEVFVD